MRRSRIDCDGRNPNVLWHKGSAGVNFVNPCSIHQKVDPVTGQKVMNFHWDASYGNRGSGTQANQVGGWTCNNFNHTSSFDVGNYYIETTSRLEQLCPNCAQNSGGPDDVYTWMTGQTDPDEVAIAAASLRGQIGNQIRTPCRPAIPCSITTAMAHFRQAMAPRRNTSAGISTMSCEAPDVVQSARL